MNIHMCVSIYRNVRTALKKERDSLLSREVDPEQQRQRDQAIAECSRLLVDGGDISGEQGEWGRQRQSLMAERDQLVAERQAQRTEIEKV